MPSTPVSQAQRDRVEKAKQRYLAAIESVLQEEGFDYDPLDTATLFNFGEDISEEGAISI